MGPHRVEQPSLSMIQYTPEEQQDLSFPSVSIPTLVIYARCLTPCYRWPRSPLVPRTRTSPRTSPLPAKSAACSNTPSQPATLSRSCTSTRRCVLLRRIFIVYRILEDASVKDMICWGPEGDCFIVKVHIDRLAVVRTDRFCRT
jgi:hypothetical protein